MVIEIAHCRLACVVSGSGGVCNTDSQGDECLSFGTAYLAAGARHVYCALFPVHHVIAVFVMSRFYHNLCRNMSEDENTPRFIARCLAQAQLWYQGLPPDESRVAFEDETIADISPSDEEHRPDNRDISTGPHLL
jgi:CHAT domain